MDERPLKIAYFTTVYPSVSHTFIRRELKEIERRGNTVFRIALRRPEMTLVDKGDIEEKDKTFYLLSRRAIVLIGVILAVIFSHPLRTARALYVACSMGRKSEVGIAKHIAYLLEAALLYHYSRKFEIDHIHVHFGTNVTAIARLAYRLGGPTYSFTVHGPAEFDSPAGLDLAGKIQDSLFTIAISDFCASQLMRWCHYTFWDKIHIIHCTVDESFYDNGNELDSESRTFVSVGRLSAQKGTFLLLKAFRLLLDRGGDGRLILVGDGELREEVEALIKNLKLEDNVNITGYVSENDVREYINSSRAVVMPSFAEGLPMVLMEAFALKRAVVSTYIAGIPELVNHENGWLVPAGNVDALTWAMEEVLSTDSDKLKVMASKGRNAVIARHNNRIEGERLNELFHSQIHADGVKG